MDLNTVLPPGGSVPKIRKKSEIPDFRFLIIFGLSRRVLGFGKGFKMILSHMAPSCFNMSSYGAIWTHFRQISMIFEQVNACSACYVPCWQAQFADTSSIMYAAGPASSIHRFALCCALAVPCFRARYSFNSILEAPNLCVRCSRLFFIEEGSIFLEALNLWVRCSRLFSSRRKAPIFSEA